MTKEIPSEKECVDCKQTFPIESFHNSPGNRYGKATCCRVCYKIRQDKSRAIHAEEVRIRSKIYAAAHAEERKPKDKEYRKKNKKRATATRLKWRASMSDERLAEFRKKRHAIKMAHRAMAYKSPVRHSRFEWVVLLELSKKYVRPLRKH